MGQQARRWAGGLRVLTDAEARLGIMVVPPLAI